MLLVCRFFMGVCRSSSCGEFTPAAAILEGFVCNQTNPVYVCSVLESDSEPVASAFSPLERTTEGKIIPNCSEIRLTEDNSIPSRSEGRPTEGTTIPSRSSRPPVLARRDHRFHSQRLVNEKHFVMMGEPNGCILAKLVPSHIHALCLYRP